MKGGLCIAVPVLLLTLLGLEGGAAQKSIKVKPTADFEVTGNGSDPAWKTTEWVPLRKRDATPNQPPGAPNQQPRAGLPYEARFKALYSKTGVYFLMDGTDRELTSTFREDFLDLWTEDVYEVFLWTDERYPVYFEYEISPLNHELPILIPNFEGKFLGWRPWHYEGKRKTRTATAAVGGSKEPKAKVKGWTAEVFIPYALLEPLENVPPKRGTRWRANVYRMDHDGGQEKATGWDWAPVGPSFHEFKSFGTLVFE